VGSGRLVDIDDWKVRLETERALCLTDGRKDIWIPRKLWDQYVEDNGDGTLTMPEWLALDKGLI
jgi:hypothetical protein